MLLRKIKNSFELYGSCKVKNYLEYLESVKPDSKYLDKDFLLKYDTIITVGMSYKKEEVFSNNKASISKYSHGTDYHIVLLDMLNTVYTDLPNNSYHVDVDSKYLDERICAYLSGFGYFGKNRFVINKDYGTFYFIGTILVKDSTELTNTFTNDSCGTCNICVENCPTKCLEPYRQEFCLSEISQSKKYYKPEVIKLLGNRIYGCDICQDICPKNANIRKSYNNEYNQQDIDLIDIDELFSMNQKEFRNKYGRSAMSYKGNLIIKRNAISYMLNNYKKRYLVYLEKELLKYSHVIWYKNTIIDVIKYMKEKNYET